MREVELKAVVGDADAVRRTVEAAGARLVRAGRLEDRRYDTADGALAARDEVIRLRIQHTQGAGARGAQLDWKGPTRSEDGYKVREEISSGVADPDAVAGILRGLGLAVTREIDREVAEYTLGGATLRFEHYPRMDVLLEVEGAPADIERAIVATGLPRAAFTEERLADFVARYEARTGVRAAVCARELTRDDRDAPRTA
jgi:predicted adenylyl cyclase CyaB